MGLRVSVFTTQPNRSGNFTHKLYNRVLTSLSQLVTPKFSAQADENNSVFSKIFDNFPISFKISYEQIKNGIRLEIECEIERSIIQSLIEMSNEIIQI